MLLVWIRMHVIIYSFACSLKQPVSPHLDACMLLLPILTFGLDNLWPKIKIIFDQIKKKDRAKQNQNGSTKKKHEHECWKTHHSIVINTSLKTEQIVSILFAVIASTLAYARVEQHWTSKCFRVCIEYHEHVHHLHKFTSIESTVWNEFVAFNNKITIVSVWKPFNGTTNNYYHILLFLLSSVSLVQF